MSWDDAVFDATNSYTFTETIKFTTQQTQLSIKEQTVTQSPATLGIISPILKS